MHRSKEYKESAQKKDGSLFLCPVDYSLKTPLLPGALFFTGLPFGVLSLIMNRPIILQQRGTPEAIMRVQPFGPDLKECGF